MSDFKKALAACVEYRAELDKLEAENKRLRNEIARLNGQTVWVCACGGTDCAGQKENADLRADKERLDWLAVSDVWFDEPATESYTPATFRAEIDRKRKAHP